MPQTNLEKINYRQRVWQFVLPAGFILMGFALALRLVAGVAYYNEQDTFWYRDWAFDLSNGFFSVYARAEQISLDYPPLYLFLLAITNFFYKIFGRDCSAYLQMLLLKFWPILADFIFGLLLYRLLGRKFGRATGLCVLLAAALSCLFYYIPALKVVPSGFVIIICAVAAAALFALLAPIPPQKGEEPCE